MSELSRRQVLRIASAGALLGVGGMPTAGAQAPASVAVWETFEASFPGPAAGNPFRDTDFAATFTLGSRQVEVEGFYDGAGIYRVRFMPDAEGAWTFTTRSNRPELNQHSGSFTAAPAKPNARGPIRVAKTFHFAHADGTPFYPFGTTCYAWIHQSDALQQQTLETLRTATFNKLRMCVFPKSYEYNHNEPALYPFVRDAAGASDFTRPNPAFFHHLEQRVLDLQALGIEADLILFHPYDRWGYATMSPEQDDRYLRYLLARISAFRNVWWSLANEFDLMRAKTASDFDRLLHLVEQYDPSSHLRSIHYSKTMYDYRHPWVTHASLQTVDFDAAEAFRRMWNKPVVYDEVQYEGNLNKRWGCISGAEMTRRFWLGLIHGCYVTHGETCLEGEANFREDATPTLWWSHGGKLHGTSPARIAFLRKLVEDQGQSAKDSSAQLQTGWEPSPDPYYLNASSLGGPDGKQVQSILYYFDFHQPIWYEFPLPSGSLSAEHIDPDTGTTTKLEGKFTGKAKITLSGRPYQAMRFRRIA